MFHAGVPVFRKYDHEGRLLFERHIEGRELDATVQSLPTSWPRRTDESDHEVPLVPPTDRTAQVDPPGNLGISLSVPYTYVYARDGAKLRTIQFRGAGLITPNSLSFESQNELLVTPGCYRFSI